MTYSPDLTYLLNIYKKCRINFAVLTARNSADAHPDGGMREKLGLESDSVRLADNLLSIAEERTIYKFTDQFMCTYIFIQLPGFSEKTVLSVGPYLTAEPSPQQLMEACEEAGLPTGYVSVLKGLLSALPALSDERLVLSPVEVYFDNAFGGDESYSVTNVNNDLMAPWNSPKSSSTPINIDTAAHEMLVMEQRYEYENQLMEAVSQGLTHKARNLLSGFSSLAFERRVPDPVRNLKNYCVVTNTLLRKAAQQGGVHPVYLDSVSSSFAAQIESSTSVDALGKLITEMARSYCRLVNRQSTRHYSPPVQKAIVMIDFDLSADLSLSQLAEMQNISSSYLSSLFKKETGKTVTDYVNEKRINHAAQLLSGTKLQIQTIASHCGIPDSNYFSKMFKKYTGSTPKEYRQNAISRPVSKGGKG